MDSNNEIIFELYEALVDEANNVGFLNCADRTLGVIEKVALILQERGYSITQLNTFEE